MIPNASLRTVTVLGALLLLPTFGAALDINSSHNLRYFPTDDLRFQVDTDGDAYLLGDLDLDDGTIQNLDTLDGFFGEGCGDNQAVRSITDDGGFTCGSAGDPQNLSEVLAQSNVANTSIDMATNDILGGGDTAIDLKASGSSHTLDTDGSGGGWQIWDTAQGTQLAQFIESGGIQFWNSVDEELALRINPNGNSNVEVPNGNLSMSENSIVDLDQLNFASNITIGDSSTSVTHPYSIAIGKSATAEHGRSIAIGRNTKPWGNSVAVGVGSGGGGESVAVGDAAWSGGTSSVAVGKDASTWKEEGGTEYFGVQAIAIGRDSLATKNNAVAFGYSAEADGTGTVAIGENAFSNQNGSVVIGRNANATDSAQFDSVVIGPEAESKYDDTVTIGSQPYTGGDDAIAIGESADAGYYDSIAIGQSATTGGAHAVAIQEDATADADDAIAIGRSARATAEGAVAIGTDALADSSYTVTVGSASQGYDMEIPNGNLDLHGSLDVDMAANPDAIIFNTDSSRSGDDQWAGLEFQDASGPTINWYRDNNEVFAVWDDTNNDVLFSLYDNGVVEIPNGNLYMDNNDILEVGSCSGCDLAETMDAEDAFENGSIIAISDTADNTVRLSNEAYDPNVVGAVSTNPVINMGGSKEGVNFGDTNRKNLSTGQNEVPVGLAGVVPVAVNDQNGVINRGDEIVASSTHGIGMRADEADDGYSHAAVIGKAMEPMHDTTGVVNVLVS